MLVVETVENPATQISARGRAASATRPRRSATPSPTPLPPLEFGRIAAQSAKQVIVQKVREAERDRQYEEYKDRIGEIVNGIVKRVEYGNVIVDLGRGEAIVRRDELIPRETFRNGDRIRAYIYDVRREQRGPQIFLSRTHPQFMAKLFAQEVPEIYDGIIEVKAVARDPGSRAKIAVISRDSSIDPVGACVGMRGSRVQAVVNELQGEKIDIIPWSQDTATFVVNALAAGRSRQGGARRGRASASRWWCPTSSFRSPSAAAARTCGSPRSSPAGTSTSSPSRRNRSAARTSSRTAPSCSSRRSTSTRWSASCSPRKASPRSRSSRWSTQKELAAIEGFDEDTARELQTRARDYLAKLEAELDAKRKELGVEDALKEVPGVTTAMLVALGENGIKTVEDLAGCATDDLVGWTERKDGESKREPGVLDGFDLSREEAEAMIMQARLKAGWITEADLAPPAGRGSRRRRSRGDAGVTERDRTDAGARAARRRARRRTAQARRRRRAVLRRHPRRSSRSTS